MTKSQWGGPYLDDPVPMDPWGNAYKFAADELNDRVTITSSGKDRQSGTEDDVPEPTAR
jgi:general secretion pathway protein G